MPRSSPLARSPLGRFGRRLSDASKGAVFLYRSSGNARIEFFLGYLALSAALAEGRPWRICAAAIATALVLAVEGMNTAIEQTVDRIGRDRHPLSAAAKDAAAGAVLLAAGGALVVAGVAFVPHIDLCWQEWQRAGLADRVLWLAGLVLAAVGVVLPERAQGRR